MTRAAMMPQATLRQHVATSAPIVLRLAVKAGRGKDQDRGALPGLKQLPGAETCADDPAGHGRFPGQGCLRGGRVAARVPGPA